MNIIGAAAAILFAWFLLSQFIAGLICVDERDFEIVQSVRAGCFMAPILILMMLASWATWQLLRIANWMGMPLFEPAGDDPLDFI